MPDQTDPGSSRPGARRPRGPGRRQRHRGGSAGRARVGVAAAASQRVRGPGPTPHLGLLRDSACTSCGAAWTGSTGTGCPTRMPRSRPASTCAPTGTPPAGVPGVLPRLEARSRRPLGRRWQDPIDGLAVLQPHQRGEDQRPREGMGQEVCRVGCGHGGPQDPRGGHDLDRGCEDDEPRPTPATRRSAGDKGATVKVIQDRLNAPRGAHPRGRPVRPRDGGAVKKFQGARRLEVDGRVGPKTWAALWR